MESVSEEVSKYSVMVGFLLVLVFVVPCITLALMAKCFQKQSGRRKSSVTLASTMGSFKYVGEDRLEATMPDSDSSGCGTFALIALSAKKLECIEKLATLKHQLNCVELWKAYAPPALSGDSEHCKKIVTVIKSAPVTATIGTSKDSHTACLKAELSYLSRIPSHHAILNLLAVCSPTTPSMTAMLMEYPLYGSLLSFLICKRLGHISNKSHTWAGLSFQKEEDSVVRALPEENRPFLSAMLDSYNVRKVPFCTPLNSDFTDVDLLLFALQIANGMQFLAENGITYRQLSAESVIISAGFFLKLSCLSPDNAFPMHKRGNTQFNQSSLQSSRRTATGRNMIKWDAPEVIEGNENTGQSNVWRYGMVLWEISSLGDTPFAEVPGKFLLEHIRKGGGLPHLPARCSPELYSIMKRCWRINSSTRPSFEDVTRILLSQLQPHERLCSERSDVMETPNQMEVVEEILESPEQVLASPMSASPVSASPMSVSPPFPRTGSNSSDTMLILRQQASSPAAVEPPSPEPYKETDV